MFDSYFLLLLAPINFFSGFEQANQPTMSDVDRRKLLSFCIVGMYSNHEAVLEMNIVVSTRRRTHRSRVCSGTARLVARGDRAALSNVGTNGQYIVV